MAKDESLESPAEPLAELSGAITSIQRLSEISRAQAEVVNAGLAKAGLTTMSEEVAASIRESLLKMPAIDTSGMTETIRRASELLVNWKALSRPRDYVRPDPPTSAYSTQMESAASYFASTEVVIDSWDDLHREITNLIGKTADLPLVWRGARRANWGLHSHLFRHLMGVNQVVSPEKRPKKEQNYPDENQMVAAEREILRVARDEWRFDNMSALELFARIQHAGGPTRLIDVTLNPYIAAWFAVESAAEDESHDARLFAIATRPVSKPDSPPAGDSTIRLDELGSLRDPFWHALDTTSARQMLDWGTGARRRLWTPPTYDPRIAAQNAAFILDGVPITSARTASYFAIERNTYWRRADLLASSSIYAKMHSPRRAPQYNSRNFAPTFSFRIPSERKAEIRKYLETRFGYLRAYIYPDVSALAQHLKSIPLSEPSR